MLIQDLTAALDLSEISKATSNLLSQKAGQTPIAFGLNLFGSSRFCRNPHYTSDRGEPLREILPLWPAQSGLSMEMRYRKIRDLYISVEDQWSPTSFSILIDAIFEEFRSRPAALVSFAERLNASLMVRASGSSDAYRAPLVAATIATSVLQFGHDKIVRDCIVSLQTAMANALDQTHQSLLQDLTNDRFTLLQPRSTGMADLFSLPKRITDIFAWCAISVVVGNFAAARVKTMKEVLRFILDNYEGSIKLMSDEQASSIAIIFSTLIRLGETDLAEEIVGLLFASLLEIGGCLAARKLDTALILKYLLMRASNDYSAGWSEVANPSEAIAVVLKAAIELDLACVVDPDMWELDKRSIFVFETEKC